MFQVNTLQKAQDCLLPMGITSENVAHHYGVTRQEQDQAAVSFGFPLTWSKTLMLLLCKVIFLSQNLWSG